MEKFTVTINGWEYNFYKDGNNFCCDLVGTFDRLIVKCTSAHDLFVYLDRITLNGYDCPHKASVMEFLNETTYTFIGAVNRAIDMGKRTVYNRDLIVSVFPDGSAGVLSNPSQMSFDAYVGRHGWRVGTR